MSDKNKMYNGYDKETYEYYIKFLTQINNTPPKTQTEKDEAKPNNVGLLWMFQIPHSVHSRYEIGAKQQARQYAATQQHVEVSAMTMADVFDCPI